MTLPRVPARGRRFRIIFAGALAGVSAITAAAAGEPQPAAVLAQPPLALGTQRQVFIDGRFLAAASGVSLVVHRPRRVGGIILQPDHPRHTTINQFASVLYDRGVYRLWYGASTRVPGAAGGKVAGNAPSAAYRTYLCYARSSDGIHWQKPALHLARAEPYDEPNIVIGVGAGGYPDSISSVGSVVVDPNAPANARFLLVLRRRSGQAGQLDTYNSGDGIHWRLTHPRVLTYALKLHELDTQNVIFWDDRINQYVAYVRRGLPQGANRARVRTTVRAESSNLAHFPNVEDSPVVFQWDSLDPAWTLPDGRRFSMVDYYNSAAIKYPFAQDAYYIFPSAYFHFDRAYIPEYAHEAPVNAGVLDIRFAASRDGVAWDRYDRSAWLPLDYDGTWDCHSLYMVRGIVPGARPDELYLYYRGSDETHGWDRNERNVRLLRAAGFAPTHDTGIARLVLRRDGFVSARANYAGGEFTTPVLTFTGTELDLNIDTSAAGEARVELQDAYGVPIPGYALSDADLIFSTNEINRRVSWRGKSDLSALVGKPVRLRIVMRDTDLYAFQFRAPQ